jgi:hypothetical protein
MTQPDPTTVGPAVADDLRDHRSAPEGIRTPNVLIRSQPGRNAVLTCGNAAIRRACVGTSDAVRTILQ